MTKTELKKKQEAEFDWRGLIGLEQVKSDLARLVDGGRMHPVLMLEGRAGLGKRHLAIWMVAKLLCRAHLPNTANLQNTATVSSQPTGPCGHCGACREVLANIHPDVMVLDKTGSSIKTADVELFQSHFDVLSPDGLRIGVIMNADSMTTEACNRLLKTLEEPPAQARVILTSSRPLSLPETIRGRCLRWRLSLPNRDDVLKWAKGMLGREGKGSWSAETVVELVRRCGYSPGSIAKRLDDQPESGLDFTEDVRTLILGDRPSEVLKAAADLARVQKAKAADVINEVEVELSAIYRKRLLDKDPTVAIGQESWETRATRRQLLNELRRQAVIGKVTLNTQLVAESLGLSRWKEGAL